jgi:mRNA-degrading endonuclease YafQ of YafQ-DinJ toxin-antitoxin module
LRLEQKPRFARRLSRLSRSDLRAVAIALVRLESNPRDPRLHTHKLEGSERWACSYAYDGRLVFLWVGDLITLLDVGTHDQVY